MLRTRNKGTIFIASTRFNSETYHENRKWRRNNEYTGCIYGTPMKMSEIIPSCANTFIIEMNNSNNKVNGIGLLKNKVTFKERIKIYKDYNYNRYIYKGVYRINRHNLKKYYRDELNLIEDIVFKRYSHSKRGQGITLIPKARIKDLTKLTDFFTQLLV